MKKDRSLQNSLCSLFCAYFKPGRNEELACRGYEVVERLLKSGRSLPFGLVGREFDRTKAESLVKTMCHACDFQADGCDFMADRTAPPCGGLVLLARLVEAGTITLEDIELSDK